MASRIVKCAEHAAKGAVHAAPLLPIAEEADEPLENVVVLFRDERLVRAEGALEHSAPPDPTDDTAPATGVLAGVLFGLAAWALLGAAAVSVYLAAHPR